MKTEEIMGEEKVSPETVTDGGKDEDEEEVVKTVTDDSMDIIDNTECKFNVNSFRLVYVTNSESYLYKRMALKRAREVGRVMSFVNFM